MTKFRLEDGPGIRSNMYRTPSGKEIVLSKDKWTEVSDPELVEFLRKKKFLEHGAVKSKPASKKEEKNKEEKKPEPKKESKKGILEKVKKAVSKK